VDFTHELLSHCLKVDGGNTYVNQALGYNIYMKYIRWFLFILVMGAGGFFVSHPREVRDWWVLRGYVPSSPVAKLALDTGMTTTGKNLFYVYDPQIEPKEKFNTDCKIAEASIVLGCYDGNGIYLYNVVDPRLAGVQEVTAAHEMLHAAYDRLTTGERERIDKLTELELARLNNERIKSVIAAYRARDPYVVPNELHSILATEVASLSPELEAHYKKYFVDRQAVVKYSEKYEQVFAEIKDKVERLNAELKLMKAQIDQKELDLTQRAASISGQRSELDRLQSSGQNAAYNRLVPAYNGAVSTYNDLLVPYRALIEEYNTKVAEHNSLSTQQNTLINSLDSKATEL
jgi:hypothetical protein